MPRLQAHLLAADLLDDLLPQAPPALGRRRVGTRRLLRASADRAVVSLFQNLRDPDGGAPRPARHPLSRALSGAAPCAEGDHRPRSFRGVHRQAGSSSGHRDCGRIGIVVRVRHRSRPTPGERKAARSDEQPREIVDSEPTVRPKHQTHVSGPDSGCFCRQDPHVQRGRTVRVLDSAAGVRPRSAIDLAQLSQSKAGTQRISAIPRSDRAR
jgi:hypothetical protein